LSVKQVTIKPNLYFDSATLMALAQKAKGQKGVLEAVAVMATAANKEILANVGLLAESASEGTARDLILAVRAENSQALSQAMVLLEEGLNSKPEQKRTGGLRPPRSVEEALKEDPELNLAVISVPGQYAAYEAKRALKAGLHVMLFSDNVPLAKEIELKKLAAETGLLMMGPDCGTAIISGAPLAFANVVRRGSIGVVAAAGTGLQEITVLVDRWGGGISQAIGTGGRDVKDAVGGLQFLEGLKALLADRHTQVVVLTGKPPAAEVEKKVLELVSKAEKPVVVNLLGGNREAVNQAGGIFAASLEEAARLALEASGIAVEGDWFEPALVSEAAAGVGPEQKWLRGLYTGGTLCYEAQLVLSRELGEIYSNTPLRKELTLRDSRLSYGHTVVDLGDDEFTRGRPHPMIEPSTRGERIAVEAEDSQVAVLLLDFVLGYGSHREPVDAVAEQLSKAMARSAQGGGKLVVVASVTGTTADPQGFDTQTQKLRKLGVHVLPSNYQAAVFAAAVIKSLGRTES
jgi:succinyl-CoA synthetase alpha subunit